MILPGECLWCQSVVVQSVSVPTRAGLQVRSQGLSVNRPPAQGCSGSRWLGGLCLPSLSLQPPGTGAAAGRALT